MIDNPWNLTWIDAAIAARIPEAPSFWTSPQIANLCTILPMQAMATCIVLFLGILLANITIRVALIVVRTMTGTLIEI